MLAPVLYVPHGGGPRPLLDDPEHRSLISFLQQLPQHCNKPEAILVISAHWEEPVPTLNAGSAPPMLYDYGGFPPESYQIQYPAPGSPELANKICSVLRTEGISAGTNNTRGYDHGVFVPLKLMHPAADIPVVQLSLISSLDAEAHIQLGEALSELRSDNILILGSGMSFHNLQSFHLPGIVGKNSDKEFDRWLVDTCVDPGLSDAERRIRLAQWYEAPQARACHPRPEHLLPLHVCFGAGGKSVAEVIYNQEILGRTVSGFMW